MAPKDDEIESTLAQGFLNPLAVECSGHVMSSFGHLGGLRGERRLVGLAVKNLDGCCMCLFLSGCGQNSLLDSTRSLASGAPASEVTEDQGQMGTPVGNGRLSMQFAPLLRRQLGCAL